MGWSGPERWTAAKQMKNRSQHRREQDVTLIQHTWNGSREILFGREMSNLRKAGLDLDLQ
jgi:hypothetical protein